MHNLNSGVKRLRAALGDSADAPRFVKTLPRIGYGFLIPVIAADAARRRSPQTGSGPAAIQNATVEGDLPAGGAAWPRAAGQPAVLALGALIAGTTRWLLMRLLRSKRD